MPAPKDATKKPGSVPSLFSCSFWHFNEKQLAEMIARASIFGLFSSKNQKKKQCRCTRENDHPRKSAPKHTTLAYSRGNLLQSNAAAKMIFNREFAWAPNSLHFAHAVRIAHAGQNLSLSFDCRFDWFWGFAHDTSRSGSAAARNQCLAHPSFSSCSLFNFSSFQKNAHDFAV